MRITIDGVDLPEGVQVDLIMNEHPQLILRASVVETNAVQVLANYADGKPHIVQWWNGETLVAEAHAPLSSRLLARAGDRPESAIYELWGGAWGRPPWYNQFIILEPDGSSASSEGGTDGGTQGGAQDETQNGTGTEG